MKAELEAAEKKVGMKGKPVPTLKPLGSAPRDHEGKMFYIFLNLYACHAYNSN
jgi:hypothetical protein